MKLLYVVATALAVGCAQVSAVVVTAFEVTYVETFDSLASSGSTGSALPADWFSAESGANADSTYGVGTGSSNTGNTYSFGASGSSERALGGVRSGTLIPLFGTRIVNGTGTLIEILDISYAGEQWRLGASGREDRLDVQYSLDATSLADGVWTDLDDLDFASPVSVGGVGLLDGNQEAHRRLLTSSLVNLGLTDGSSLWLRWLDFDASGADDGLGIDDFQVTARRGPEAPPVHGVPDVFSTVLGLGLSLAALAGLRRRGMGVAA